MPPQCVSRAISTGYGKRLPGSALLRSLLQAQLLGSSQGGIMSSDHFIRRVRWCKGCAAEKEQIRLPTGYVCEECDSLNDGVHPAEKSDVIREEREAGLKLIRKNINRQRIFPQLLHGEHHYTTAVSSRSIKLKIFRRSKHTSI